MLARGVKAVLSALASPEKAKASAWFFKTAPGEYGAGDRLLEDRELRVERRDKAKNMDP